MLTSNQLATANKGALRQFMRDAGVSYKGLTVDAMRAALATHVVNPEPDPVFDAQVVQLAPDVPTMQIGGETMTVAPYVPGFAARLTSKGVKIEKDRATANGVRMPSAGTACRAVWDYLQEECDHGRTPTAKSVKEYASRQGWNTNNASIEFYNWRKFNGVTGRTPRT